MFRLLEIQVLEYKNAEGGHRHENVPDIRNASHLEVHLRKCKAVATAYLRAAQAYMLISMPTGTSTIFGVFQAILALLQETGRTPPSRVK